MDTSLKDGERLDKIGFGGLSIIQKPEEFCYGIDAVLLADFAKLKAGSRAIDLGTGTGIIPLILSYKTVDTELWGVEIQESSWERSVRTAKFNGLSDRLHFICDDIKNAPDVFGLNTFDAVTTNPPYNGYESGLKNANMAKYISRHETTATIEDFIAVSSNLLRNHGDFYMIHRPSRLVDIFFYARAYSLEPKEIKFVAPNRNRLPNLVLIHCVKNGGSELKLLDTLYVYNEKGGYTSELERIYE